MSSTYITAALRRFVMTRAQSLCEYCLIHEDDTYFGCQVDHIISEKHSGLTIPDNLAYACSFCNRAKGSDVRSIIRQTGLFSRFFNPRIDRWSEHFALDEITIISRTEIDEVTAHILDFNHIDRLLERQVLQELSRYPSVAAFDILSR